MCEGPDRNPVGRKSSWTRKEEGPAVLDPCSISDSLETWKGTHLEGEGQLSVVKIRKAEDKIICDEIHLQNWSSVA